MSKPTYKNEIVRNYIRKFPNTSSRGIARKIWQENSAEFTFETALSMVHYIRGTTGKKNLDKLGDKSLIIAPFSFKNPFELPKSDATKPKIFTLPRSCNRVLVLSDLHIPYHDVIALTTALNYGKENKANCILINGDLLDFYQISRFTNIERKRSVQEEINITKQFLDSLNKFFPSVPIYFLKGNHCNRLEFYLATHAPELLDVEEFRLSYLLEAEKHNMEVLDDTTLVKIGKLNVTHGHLLLRGIFAPVSPARGVFLRSKTSTLIGHTHKVSTHSETTITGKNIVCYSSGCLCELNPNYSPFANNFTHGFTMVFLKEAGNYSVRNLQIIDGKIIN